MSRRFVVLSLAVRALSGSAEAAEEPLRLETYVELVRRTHPAARRVEALEAAARAERRAARLPEDPQVEMTRGRARPSDDPSARAWERELAVRQTVPWPGRWRASIAAADREADALRAAGSLAGWQLEVEARHAFSRLAALRTAVVVARESEEQARAVRDLVGRRTEAGEAREADRIRAEVEWMRQQRDRRAAEVGAAAAESAVRALAAGHTLPSPLVLADESAAREQAGTPAVSSAPAPVPESHPRLAAAAAAAARARALVSAARRGRIPDLELAVASNREIDKRTTAVSLALRLPLWNAARGEIARAEAARDLAESDLEQARLEIQMEGRQRASELSVAADRLRTLELEILPAAQRTAGLARLIYEAGETSLLDLLDAQRTHIEARRELIEARLALVEALARLRLVAGPSFDPWSQQR